MQKEVESLKKLMAAKDNRIKELKKELAAAKGRAVSAEREVISTKQAVEEAVNRMKDVNSLACFLC